MNFNLTTYNLFNLTKKDINLILIDDNTFRPITSIGILVGIFTPIGTGIAFFVNLRNRVKTLENLLKIILYYLITKNI